MSIVYIKPIGALFDQSDKSQNSLSVIARDGKVIDVSPAALKAGIYPGRRARSISCIYPELEVIDYDEALHTSNLNKVRDILYTLSPVIEPDDIDTFVEIPAQSVFEVTEKLLAQSPAFLVIAGVAESKFLAKAMTLNAYMKTPPEKLPGAEIKMVPPGETANYLRALPIDFAWPIPKVVRSELSRAGLRTFEDVLRIHKQKLIERFGNWGARLVKLARGEDIDPIKPAYPEPYVKAAFIFQDQCSDYEQIDYGLKYLASYIGKALETRKCAAKRLCLEAESETGHSVNKKSLTPPCYTPCDILWNLRSLASKIKNPSFMEAKATCLTPIPIRQITLLETSLHMTASSPAPVNRISNRRLGEQPDDSTASKPKPVEGASIHETGKRQSSIKEFDPGSLPAGVRLDTVVHDINHRYGKQVIQHGRQLAPDWIEGILSYWDPVRGSAGLSDSR